MISRIFNQPIDEALSSALSIRRLDDLDVVVVDHSAVRASIALQGAHLLSWQPAGEDDVLWLSAQTPFAHGKAIRGGVPICWPWFGPAQQADLPAHGFARNLPWQLSAHQQDEDGVVLTLELQSSDETRRMWPHDFTLYARFRLGKRCEIELEAHGEFETTAALHSYFQVGDINTVKVSGLGARYLDKVAGGGGEGQLDNGIQTFPDRTDRVYLSPEDCSLLQDSTLQRTLEITHHYHTNVVGWNPGPALSVSMADVPDDGYRHFVCVETAAVTVPQTAKESSPSRLGVTLRVLHRPR